MQAVRCPKCGPRSGELERCGLCGTRLVIGPPLEQCYPEKPFSADIKPVILLQERRMIPELAMAAGPGPGGEDAEAEAGPAIKALNLTTEPSQMEGVPRDHVRLAVNESVTVYARGLDDAGKWCILPEEAQIKWRSDRDIHLTPGPGHTALMKLVGSPKVSAVATARTTVGRRKLQRTFTVEKI